MPSTNDHRDVQELDRLRAPAEARAIIDSQLRRLEHEHVPLSGAAWRVLAEDVTAPENHPSFAASTMDGYAVFAEDTSPWREIIDEQKAGKVVPSEVTDGYTVKIMTGAPLPPGADAVVPVEATDLMEDHVVIHQEDISLGQNVRAIGADIRQGEVLVRAGTVLDPASLGLLASMGITPVPVVRRPSVSILSTGDELVDPDEAVGPGQIRDSNRFSLAAALAHEPALHDGRCSDHTQAPLSSMCHVTVH